MRKATVILNPRAGKGRGANIRQRLQERLKHHGFEFDLLPTERSEHAIELARKAKSDFVVAVGGDGTVNEVVNGIAGSDRILGVVSCGSGNDLIKSLGISGDLDEAVEQLATREPRGIDVGTVVCSGADRAGISQERLFVNGLGVGFDAAVAARAQTFRHLRGTSLYLASVFLTLGEYRAPLFKISGDGLALGRRCLLIAVGNGTCAGGGFYLTPGAQIDDGLLDVCVVNEISLMGILKLMPQVMKGAHSNRKEITMARTRSLTVEADAGFFVHADGEIIGRGSRSVKVGIRPKFIPVVH